MIAYYHYHTYYLDQIAPRFVLYQMCIIIPHQYHQKIVQIASLPPNLSASMTRTSFLRSHLISPNNHAHDHDHTIQPNQIRPILGMLAALGASSLLSLPSVVNSGGTFLQFPLIHEPLPSLPITRQRHETVLTEPKHRFAIARFARKSGWLLAKL